MTPKEKAKEMVNKMHGVTPPRDILELLYSDKEIAKQCALIAVDEMIEQQQIQAENMIWSCVEYWQEVKQEIEAL